MDRSPIRDIIVGLFVLAGLGAIGYLSIVIGGFTWGSKGGMVLTADFNETGGLTIRSPVKIAGVNVGEVTDISLDQSHFRAHVTMSLRPDLKMSTDTIASIYTSGLLGDRFVQLSPGGEEQNLKSGDIITQTNEAMILEKVLGQVVFGLTKDDSKNPNSATQAGTKPAKLP